MYSFQSQGIGNCVGDSSRMNQLSIIAEWLPYQNNFFLVFATEIRNFWGQMDYTGFFNINFY